MARKDHNPPMRIILLLLLIILLIFVASVLILLIAWPISALIGWLWAVEPQWSLGLALVILLLLTLAVHGAIMLAMNHLLRPLRAVNRYYFDDEDEDEDYDEDEDDEDDEDEEEVDLWLEPCPCGSGRTFRECCGGRADRNRRH